MSLYCFLTILLWTGRLGIGMNGRIRIGIGGRFTQEYADANYWISRPPIPIRGLPLIPIPSQPLKLKK